MVVGWSIGQTDRQIKRRTGRFSRGGFPTDSTVNPLVCWFPARVRPCEPPHRLAFGALGGKRGKGEVAEQFLRLSGSLRVMGGNKKKQNSVRVVERESGALFAHHLHCHITGMFSAEQDT